MFCWNSWHLNSGMSSAKSSWYLGSIWAKSEHPHWDIEPNSPSCSIWIIPTPSTRWMLACVLVSLVSWNSILSINSILLRRALLGFFPAKIPLPIFAIYCLYEPEHRDLCSSRHTPATCPKPKVVLCTPARFHQNGRSGCPALGISSVGYLQGRILSFHSCLSTLPHLFLGIFAKN